MGEELPRSKRRYSARAWIHLIPVLVVWVCAYVTNGLAEGKFVRGNAIFHYGFVAAVWALMLLVVWLYLASGIVRYEVSRDGLFVRRFRTRFYSWDKVKYIHWNDLLHFIRISGSTGTISFNSTDWFPGLFQLVRLIHERSGCELSGNLHDLLEQDLDKHDV